MKHDPRSTSSGEIEAAAARWVARSDAGLSPADERELQAWIDSNPLHREALVFYDSAWSALGKPAQSGTAALLEVQLNALAARRRRNRVAAGSVVLVALIAIGVATWGPLPFNTERAAPHAVVLLPANQILPDGSVVELKGSARIVVDYTASLRRVSLREGEAHFAVQKDTARPFVVSAGDIEVRAVGTAFSVQLGSTAVDVVVTEGRVAVDRSPAGATHAEAPMAVAPLAMLDAGKHVAIDLARSPMTPEVRSVPPLELKERLAWRSPVLEFTRTPLSEAVALLNQHAPAPAPRLEVADAALGVMRVTGVFRAENTEGFVLLLEGAFGVKASRLGNTILLRKSATEANSR